MHLTYLDVNSWLIELDGLRILLDPWLVGDVVLGKLSWLFKLRRDKPLPIPEAIDLILLSQGLEDHAHPETLQTLDKAIPVVASPSGAKVAEQCGFAQVTALAHGESWVGDRITIQAVPGSPFGPLLTENGYLLTSQSGVRLYYEPHGNHDASLQHEAPVDVAITPIMNLELPLVGPIIKGQANALQLATWLKPRFMLSTAAGGDAQVEGILANVLKTTGTIEEFQALLTAHQLKTQVINPKPGDRLALDLATV